MLRTPTGVAAAALAGVLAVAPASAALAGTHGHGHGHTKTHATGHHHGKPAAKRFTATGKVVSVAGDQLTMHAKGGSRALHGQDVVVTVPETAKVNRDDAPAALADLVAGDHVMVNGTRDVSGDTTVLTARHVNAASRDDDAADGTVDDGTVDDGTVDDGTVDDGTVDDGTVDDGTVTDGTVDGGTTDGTPTV